MNITLLKMFLIYQKNTTGKVYLTNQSNKENVDHAMLLLPLKCYKLDQPNNTTENSIYLPKMLQIVTIITKVVMVVTVSQFLNMLPNSIYIHLTVKNILDSMEIVPISVMSNNSKKSIESMIINMSVVLQEKLMKEILCKKFLTTVQSL